MSWDYFALFAIVALLFWGLGAFAVWRGKRPVVVHYPTHRINTLKYNLLL